MPVSYLVALTALAVTVVLMLAASAAVIAAYLARKDGALPAAVVGRAGMAFASTVTFVALVVTTLTDLLR